MSAGWPQRTPQAEICYTVASNAARIAAMINSPSRCKNSVRKIEKSYADPLSLQPTERSPPYCWT